MVLKAEKDTGKLECVQTGFCLTFHHESGLMQASHDLQSFFQRESLNQSASDLSEQYRTASPFPHIVLDDFFPPTVLDEVLEAVQYPDESWHQFLNDREVKRQLSDETQMDPRIQFFIYKLNSRCMLEFLENLTGIKGLVSDPYLEGGGLHQLQKSGFLKIHADFNYHKRMKLDRRINMLVYLNKDWKEEYEGHLEFWDEPLENCVQRVLPVFNRVVIFNTTSTSWHGNPKVLACPDGWTRKSIAMYYYTNGRPEEEKRDVHGTLFKRVPGDQFADGKIPKRLGAKGVIKQLVPPIVISAGKRLLRRDRASETPS